MIIGTAGHIDHGKTALIRALTGVETDRLKEEKARGISIDLGFAYQDLPDGEVLGFVDVPGHERFIHNMLAGATGIDEVLLVVAADDGPMPQTREHLQILDLLGLSTGVVALSKIDRVDPQRLMAAEAEIRDLLQGTALADAPIFPVSSQSGAGVAALRGHLHQAAMRLPPRGMQGGFRLAVDRVFTLSGSGIVVTGTIFSGRVQVGDRLLLSPAGLELRVRGIHAQNRPASEGMVGQRCALNVSGPRLEKNMIQRGDWVLAPEAHAPTAKLDVQLQVSPEEARALRHWSAVHVHLAAAHRTGHVALLENDVLLPGETAWARLVLDQEIAALHGDRFVLRDQSARRTLGGGWVVDAAPPARHARRPERLQALHALSLSKPDQALNELLALQPGGVDLNAFCRNRNLHTFEAAALLEQMPMRQVAGFGFAPGHWQARKDEFCAALDSYHEQQPDVPGATAGLLRSRLTGFPPPELVTALIEELLAQGEIIRDGPWLHRPAYRARLSDADEALWLRIAPILSETGFQPPRVRDLARMLEQDEDRIRQCLRRLARLGQVLAVAHDHYFPRARVAELAAIVEQLAQAQERFSVTAYRDRIGIGRKLSIHILEFFDRCGLTRRRGDWRELRQPASNLFGRPAAGE